MGRYTSNKYTVKQKAAIKHGSQLLVERFARFEYPYVHERHGFHNAVDAL